MNDPQAPQDQPAEDEAARSEVNENGGDSFEDAQAIDAEPHADPSARSLTTWRPEDAANFLASAIREAQRPYAEAMRRPSVPSQTVALVVGVLAIFIVGLFYLLIRTEETGGRAGAGPARDAALAAQAELTRLEAENQTLHAQLEKERRHSADLMALVESAGESRAEQRARVAELEQTVAEKEEQLEQAVKRIEELSAQLADQEEMQARLTDTARLLKEALREAGKQKQAARLLQEQLDAQAEAMAALQKQLQAARKLGALASGEAGEAAEPAVQPAPDGAGVEKTDAPEEAAGAEEESPAEAETEAGTATPTETPEKAPADDAAGADADPEAEPETENGDGAEEGAADEAETKEESEPLDA
jgi:hypothetical protein